MAIEDAGVRVAEGERDFFDAFGLLQEAAGGEHSLAPQVFAGGEIELAPDEPFRVARADADQEGQFLDVKLRLLGKAPPLLIGSVPQADAKFFVLIPDSDVAIASPSAANSCTLDESKKGRQSKIENSGEARRASG